MTGMDRSSGTAISGIEHLKQSVHDILTTPLGSRLMCRDYGSLIPSLIDQPDNASTRVRLYAAVASALMRWEPRLKLKTVGLASGQRPGQRVIDIEGVYYDSDSGAVSVSLQVNAMGAVA